jgi:hypothetical protein
MPLCPEKNLSRFVLAHCEWVIWWMDDFVKTKLGGTVEGAESSDGLFKVPFLKCSNHKSTFCCCRPVLSKQILPM